MGLARFVRPMAVLAMLLGPLSSELKADCLESYIFGAGQGDITGAMAEMALNGYGDLGHRSEGMHQRLRARAFYFQDPCSRKQMALVINDLAMMHDNVRQDILSALAEKLPGVFNEDNLMVSATHTHAGQGAYGYRILYNVPARGFSKQALEVIVEGNVEAIVRAYRNQQPARLEVSQSSLEGVGWNRSLDAYRANPSSVLDRFDSDTDQSVLVLSAKDLNDQPLASLNWFAVHPVSLPLTSKVLSGDNKGLASYFVEKALEVDYLQDDGFVAGFFQSNSGDVSPYDFTKPFVDEKDYWDRLEVSAKKQASKNLELLENTDQSLSVNLDYRATYVDMQGYEVRSDFERSKTCSAALGVAFAAGTENGQPLEWFKEGTVYGVNWPKITLLPQEQECQQEKVILLPTGKVGGWTARIFPFQLFVIGELAVMASPFETTTTAGRLLKQYTLEKLSEIGVKYIAITGLANEYGHYLTTKEEYATQNYEGGSTLFGPNSFAATRQIFDQLAGSIISGTKIDPGPRPNRLSWLGLPLSPGVVFDSVPAGKSFGDPADEPSESYQIGDDIEVSFWSGHPKNDLRRGSSYIYVQLLEGDGWQDVAYDWDHSTILRWKRSGLANSQVSLKWITSRESELMPGTYRVCHKASSKNLLGKIRPYSGCTRSFEMF